jgi:hypothetical protein
MSPCGESQGMAALLPRKGLSTEGVYDVIMRVLTEESFQAAAQKVSKRIRSRKRTPLQEAAGELPSTSNQPSYEPLADPSRMSNCTPPFALVDTKAQGVPIVEHTTQHNTTQHNTTQHNTTQHNTTQHNTTVDLGLTVGRCPTLS